MLRVRDIMTRDVVSVAEDSSLDSAAWKFASESVTGAPVRDARGNVIGVLSKSDLVDPLRQGDKDAPVRDAMTFGVWAVHPDEPAIEAVKLMVEAAVHRVIVVRGPGKLEGIVTSMDVMRVLVGGGDFHGLSSSTRTPEKLDDEDGDAGDAQAAGVSA